MQVRCWERLRFLATGEDIVVDVGWCGWKLEILLYLQA